MTEMMPIRMTICTTMADAAGHAHALFFIELHLLLLELLLVLGVFF